MKIKESNFVEELSHRNEKALEYVMVHYGGLVKSVVHRYLNVLSQYEEECINDVLLSGSILTLMIPHEIPLPTGLAELPG